MSHCLTHAKQREHLSGLLVCMIYAEIACSGPLDDNKLRRLSMVLVEEKTGSHSMAGPPPPPPLPSRPPTQQAYAQHLLTGQHGLSPLILQASLLD